MLPWLAYTKVKEEGREEVRRMMIGFAPTE